MAIDPNTGLELQTDVAPDNITEDIVEPLPVEQEQAPIEASAPVELQTPTEVDVLETTKQVEPTVSIPEEVKAPTVEETVQIEEKPVETTVKADEQTPIDTIQETKSDKLANEETERKIAAENKVAAANQFDNALKSGASIEELAKIFTDNPDSKEQFNTLARNHFKNNKNAQFFKKYSGMSNEQMTTAVNNSDIVIGSDEYKLLSPEQRASFEQFYKESTANRTQEEEDRKFNNDENKIISNSKQEEEIASFTGLNVREASKNLFNTPEIKASSESLRDKRNEIDNLNKIIKGIRKDVDKQYPTLSASAKASVIADRTERLNENKNTLINEYNSELGNYTRLKDGAEQELELLKYEDQVSRQEYNTQLSLYETRRKERREDIKDELDAQAKIKSDEQKRADELEDQAFLVKNQKIASDTALNNAKTLAKFKDDIAKGTIKGKWQDRFDGLYFLSDTGEAQKVINGGYDKSTDGTSTYTYTDNDNNVISETRDINGNLMGAGTGNTNFNQKQVDLLNATNGSIIPTRLKQTTNPNGGKECAEYVNDIFSSSTGERMGDTYQSKLNVATEKTGRLGSLAVWQPNPSNKEFSKFGHAGFIVGESDDKSKWHVKSSNLNGDGKISIVSVPKTAIAGYKNTTLFNKTVQKDFNDAQLNFLETVDTSKGFNKEAKATIKNLGLTEQDVFGFKATNLPKDKIELAETVLAKISNLKGDDGKFSSARGFSGAVGFGFGEALLPGTRSGDFASDFESFKSILTVENLDKMSGVLTDKDIEILKSAALSIGLGNSEKQFSKRLKEVEDVYKKALGQEVITKENLYYTNPNTGKQFTKNGFKTKLLQELKDGTITSEQATELLRKNNLQLK